MQTPPIMIASRPVDGSTSSATTCGTIVWVRNANRNLMHQEAVDLHNPNPTHQNGKSKSKSNRSSQSGAQYRSPGADTAACQSKAGRASGDNLELGLAKRRQKERGQYVR